MSDVTVEDLDARVRRLEAIIEDMKAVADEKPDDARSFLERCRIKDARKKGATQ